MIKIAICVCTRRRPEGILTLLKSFESLQVPQNTDFKIIIVENDYIGKSELPIKKFSSKSKIKIHYVLETKQGIANARNRSVKEAGNVDFCCFVDDDQSVESDWLVELMRCQKEFDADGVWGTNPPIFLSKVSLNIQLFHQPQIFPYGSIVKKAATNCLLLKRSWLTKFKGPFDIRLNFSGGEDTYLTTLISNNGGIIRFNPLAKANEIIPKNRSTIKYVVKRTVRMANTRYYVESLIEENYSKLSKIPRLILRFLLGMIILLPYFISKTYKFKGLIKLSDAIGGFIFIFGSKNEFYK